MIVMTVFLSILNQMEFPLVQSRKENCHDDHIPFNVKGNANIVFSVYDVHELFGCTVELLMSMFFRLHSSFVYSLPVFRWFWLVFYSTERFSTHLYAFLCSLSKLVLGKQFGTRLNEALNKDGMLSEMLFC